MLIDRSQQEGDDWNKELLAYERKKRTKFPHGRDRPGLVRRHVSHHDAIEKELRFNPLLGVYREEVERNKSMEMEAKAAANERDRYERNNRKYTVDYDIVNFKPSVSLPPCEKTQPQSHETRKKEHINPNYQHFDIINGSQHSQEYLRKINFHPTKEYSRRHHHSQRTRDIINGSYSTLDPHVNSTISYEEDEDTTALRQAGRSQEKRDWNSLMQQYHNPEKEEQYQKQRRHQELAQARQDASAKLPPAYRNREEIGMDISLPPSEIVQELQRRQQRIRDRYKVKYEVEHQQSLRNQYDEEKKEREARNRVHLGRVFNEKKRHNPINSLPYGQSRAQQLYGKPVPTSPYKINLNESLALSSHIQASPIKQRAFSQAERSG